MTLSGYLLFFIWLFILILLSFLIDKIWSRIIGKKYRFFVLIGVIVHELSHALVCLLTGAKIYSMNFFAKEGGYVKHGRSKFHFVGNALIAMAPIFGAFAALWGLIYYFGLRFDFSAINFSNGFFENFRILFQSSWVLVKQGYQKWQFWVLLYLIISICAALAPSKQDFKNAIWGLLFLFLIGLIILYFQETSNFLNILIGKYLSRVVVLGIFMEIISLIAGLPFYFLRKFSR
jgi:hypothetical protein